MKPPNRRSTPSQPRARCPGLAWLRAIAFAVALPASALLAAAGKTVTAERGDGIYRLLERHGLPAEKYFRAFVELNRKNLGPNNTLYQGRTYQLPATSQVITEPLFGR